MSLFQNLFSSSHGPKDGSGPETGPVKMDLEERMAFRREMLFDSVKTTLESRGIPRGSYRFKVVRADKRGHSFVVMVDLSIDFMDSDEGSQRSLMALAAALGKNALARYGLGVAAVYWRVNEELKPVDSQPSISESAGDSHSAEATRAANVRTYERATAQELAAFEAAWKKGSDLVIGDRSYSSDLAPLTGADGKDSH
jgi:hypothetical protein